MCSVSAIRKVHVTSVCFHETGKNQYILQGKHGLELEMHFTDSVRRFVVYAKPPALGPHFVHSRNQISKRLCILDAEPNSTLHAKTPNPSTPVQLL